jgi:guanylate kinase
MNNHKPFLIIISSPSGAGKSTLCDMVLKNDKNIKLSISATTRPKRLKEIDGQDYYFLSKEKFLQMVKDDQFIEHANVFDNDYGTPKKMVEDELQNGHEVIFDIDWQGARQIKEKFKSDPNLIVSIFILPPSLQELERRLKNRAQDDDETVKKRMIKAQDEISHFNEYEHVLINDNLQETYQKIVAIIDNKRQSLVTLTKN